jgi:hypothetical protein
MIMRRLEIMSETGDLVLDNYGTDMIEKTERTC